MLGNMTAPTQPETVIPEWSVADRLRKIRRDYAHMDQDEFADALGVKPSRYGAWETGRNKPENPVALAMRVEEVTGVPAAWTLGVYGGLTPVVRHQGLEPRTRWFEVSDNFISEQALVA